MSRASSTLHPSHQHLPESGAHCPEAGAEGRTRVPPGAEGWALRCTPPPPPPDREQRAGQDHSPCRRRASARPWRRGPEGTRCGGGVWPSLPGPAALAVPPDRHPTRSPPNATAATALQPRLHSAPRAPTFPGRSADPSSRAPLRVLPPRQSRGPTKPLVFVLSFRHPQVGGARDSPRRDSLQLNTGKKSPVLSHRPQPVWGPRRLAFA